MEWVKGKWGDMEKLDHFLQHSLLYMLTWQEQDTKVKGRLNRITRIYVHNSIFRIYALYLSTGDMTKLLPQSLPDLVPPGSSQLFGLLSTSSRENVKSEQFLFHSSLIHCTHSSCGKSQCRTLKYHLSRCLTDA